MPIIQDIDALKSWLTKKLTPICDADPAPLSKYVVALAKKDKPEDHLKKLCTDQLEVFLQGNTIKFVDDLFDALRNHTYIQPQAKPLPDNSNSISAAAKTTFSSPPTSGANEPSSSSTSSILCSTKRRDSEEAIDDGDRDYKRSRGTRSRSPRDDHRRGNRDDDRGRRRDDRSDSRKGPTRPGVSAHHRDRQDEGWHSSRGRDRDYRSHDSMITNNQCTESPDHLSDIPSPISVVTSIGSGSGNSRQQIRGSYRGRGRSKGLQRGNHRNNYDRPAHQNLKPRCRDYDEKGFCMRGELCPFDHGNDPVIVDDINLPNMLPIHGSSRPPPPLPSQPPPQQPPPPQIPPHPPIPLPRQPLGPPPILPPGPPPGPMLRPLPGVPPDMHRFPPPTLVPPPLGPPPGNIRPRLPQTQMPSGMMPPPSLMVPPLDQFEPDGYNPEEPALDSGQKKSGFVIPSRSRELIGVQTVPIATQQELAAIEDAIEISSAPAITRSNSRTVIDTHSLILNKAQSTRQIIQTIPQNRKRTLDEYQANSVERHGEPCAKQDVRLRLGWKKPWLNNRDNACLVIRKIPRNLNTVSKLSQHFEKFGTIVNLQVAFDGDPEAALITFTHSDQARTAIGCTEAVLNNRFIKVYWHNKDNNQAGSFADETAKEVKPPVRERIVIPSKEQLSINNKKQDAAEKAIVKQSVTGLCKTVYNPSALRTNQTASKLAQARQELASAKEAVRLKKQKETLQRRNSIERQKQELMSKQIQEQKLLIEKLEKGKGLSAEVRASILGAMKALGKAIDKTKAEIIAKPITKTVTSTQKELLDTELELYNQQAEGGDTTQLKRRVAQLKFEAQSLGLLSSGRGRGGSLHNRGRGRGGYRRGRGKGNKSNTMLDKRPRELAISGFVEADKDEIITHFAEFGELEKIEYTNANNTLVIGFQSRMEAEIAATKGQNFKTTMLKMAWHKPTPEVLIVEEEIGENLDISIEAEEEENDDDPFPGDDEDEEDDEESRGWRR